MLVGAFVVFGFAGAVMEGGAAAYLESLRPEPAPLSKQARRGYWAFIIIAPLAAFVGLRIAYGP